MSNSPEPLPVELLVPADKRCVTVDQHKAFRESLALPSFDDDDDDVVIDPYEHRAGSRKSDRDLNRLLGVLDSLKSNRKAPTK